MATTPEVSPSSPGLGVTELVLGILPAIARVEGTTLATSEVSTLPPEAPTVVVVIGWSGTLKCRLTRARQILGQLNNLL